MRATALLRFNPESEVMQVWLGDHWQDLPEAEGEGEYVVFSLPIDVEAR